MIRKDIDSKEEKKVKQDRYSIHSIEKALDVIEVLSVHDSLSLIEMAVLVHQPKSSLFRIIQTLESRSFISRSEESGKYCLGLKQLVIAKNMLERNTLRTSSLSEMHKLVDKYGDTVNLCVLADDEVLYMEIIEGTYALRMSDKVGSKAPIYATATGKAIASTLQDADVRRLLEQKEMIAATPNTITTIPDFLKEMTKIRNLGYALDNQEIVLGARCIAAPIFNVFGKVEGAISLSGALHHFQDENIHTIAEDVKAAALTISQKLGYVI